MGIAAQYMHGAKVCIIPHPDNNFEPRVLKRKPLSVIALFLVLAKVVTAGFASILPLPAELSTITNARIVQLTNVERVETGLNELIVNDQLTRAAENKARDMLSEDYFAHISPSGVTPWFWMGREGYKYEVAGENLAIDFVETENVVSAWMASPTHKANIVHPSYTEIGVAVATGGFQGGTSTVVVQMFGLPMGETRGSQDQLPEESSEPQEEAQQPIEVIDEVPPSPPIINIVGGGKIVRNSAHLQIKGEGGSSVQFLINEKADQRVLLSAVGEGVAKIDLAEIEDGDIFIKAYAVDKANNKSGFSTIELVKDTSIDEVTEKDFVFLLSPKTDGPEAALRMPAGDFKTIAVSTGKNEFSYDNAQWVAFPIESDNINFSFSDLAGNKITVTNVALGPAFYVERNIAYMKSPKLLEGARVRLITLMVLVLLILLILSILIRVRVQRPRMIAQASLVILLAIATLLI